MKPAASSNAKYQAIAPQPGRIALSLGVSPISFEIGFTHMGHASVGRSISIADQAGLASLTEQGN